MDGTAATYLAVFALLLVIHILMRIQDLWSEPKYKELAPHHHIPEPLSEVVEPDDRRWEEMEPEEDPQPARFRRWDGE